MGHVKALFGFFNKKNVFMCWSGSNLGTGKIILMWSSFAVTHGSKPLKSFFSSPSGRHFGSLLNDFESQSSTPVGGSLGRRRFIPHFKSQNCSESFYFRLLWFFECFCEKLWNTTGKIENNCENRRFGAKWDLSSGSALWSQGKEEISAEKTQDLVWPRGLVDRLQRRRFLQSIE